MILLPLSENLVLQVIVSHLFRAILKPVGVVVFLLLIFTDQTKMINYL